MRFSRRWFKPIPEFPDYWINKRGQIYSARNKKFLKWNFNSRDYPRVWLSVKGVSVRFFVHRLVAIVFCDNPDPINKIEVNHLDYDKRNPYYKNLRWDTPEDNRAHAKKRSWSTFVNERDKLIPCPF